MLKISDESVSETKMVDFGCVPIDTVQERCVSIKNTSNVSSCPCLFTLVVEYPRNKITI